MKYLALGLLTVIGLALAPTAIRRIRWNDATAQERYRAGTMSDAEKRYRGFYPYHNGPFA